MNKRINIMSTWKEFNPSALKSMKDDFAREMVPYISTIIAYLDNGKTIIASPSCSIDVFSGERIDKTKCILTDGEYSWSNSLSYYVQKYNLQLPEEFLLKILKN